jgi:NAD(P)-dependent dehydrogenase (short-subunit alcohol dehydrogenase family)
MMYVPLTRHALSFIFLIPAKSRSHLTSGPHAPTSFVYPDTHFILQVLDVNLKSVWLLSQAAGRHMVPRRQGKIINFCSLLTFQGGFTVPAYAAAKGALGQLTKALSNEWSRHNVQVNGICPGYIDTDM